MGRWQRSYFSKKASRSPPATMPAPWLWRRGVGLRSRMVVLCPICLRAMPQRRPPKDPPAYFVRRYVKTTGIRATSG